MNKLFLFLFFYPIVLIGGAMRSEDAHSIINYYKKICDKDPSIFSHEEWQANEGPRKKLLKACRFVDDPQLIQDGQEIMRRFDRKVSPKDVLVDVIALSRRYCTQPIQGCLAYATRENFVGRVIAGYHPEASDVCLVTSTVAKQLCLLQNELVHQGLSLFIFDAYRPLRAVRDWSNWYRQPAENEYEKERKKVHYPHLEKEDLIRLGYAPDTVSRHCFGHVVDVTLVNLQDGKLLNMGTDFDYFDSSSHLDAGIEIIGEEAVRNREFLVKIMQRFGFMPYEYEWWHFDYQKEEVNEPMDLEITPDLKGLGSTIILR